MGLTNILSERRLPPSVAGERAPSIETHGVRVIYIMGYGHSGSTVLNAMLAGAPDVEGIGELASLSSAGWREDGIQACACGAPVRGCDFWETVGRRWKALTGEKDFRAMVSLRGFFGGWRPKRAAHRWNPETEPSFGELDRLVRALYRSIGEISGRTVIVDASKAPQRARFLSRIPELDLRVIHLVRDSRAVAWSMRRRKSSVVRTAMAWALHNRLCDGVRKTLPANRVCLVRYEDLVFRTPETLRRIGECVNVDLRGVAGRVARSEPIRFRHEVGGNRVRQKRAVPLKPDVAWIREMPRSQQQLVWFLNRKMLRAYGYERRS